MFVFIEVGSISEYGMRYHHHSGSDVEKLEFLQAAVDSDFKIARRFKLRRTFKTGQWKATQRQGLDIGLFNEGLTHFRASEAPIICVTAIVDGKPRIDIKTDLASFRGEKVGQELPGDMEDWLIKYTEGDKFRFDKLINDDYFSAIKLLFNAKHMASAAKLLMSCIDTMAYVEYGDTPRNLANWLEDRKRTRLNTSHSAKPRMPSCA